MDKSRVRDYVGKYRLKRILKNDKVIKYSLDDKDNRYLSTKEHLAVAASTTLPLGCDPREIDAYNYQEEFIEQKYIKSDNDNLRQNIITAMILRYYTDGGISIEEMIKYGFKPFYKIE